jgi:hypothetical protein
LVSLDLPIASLDVSLSVDKRIRKRREEGTYGRNRERRGRR